VQLFIHVFPVLDIDLVYRQGGICRNDERHTYTWQMKLVNEFDSIIPTIATLALVLGVHECMSPLIIMYVSTLGVATRLTIGGWEVRSISIDALNKEALEELPFSIGTKNMWKYYDIGILFIE
jgi:hypothetical protein